MSNLPNFLVVGFPKCGTTSLHYYLNEHPEIFMPKQKELHFFTCDKLKALDSGPKDDLVSKFHIDKLSSYKKIFNEARSDQIIGEVSPSYINYPNLSIPRIKKLLGNPKIIILLRDPIERAYSNYLHLVREEREHLSFYEALQVEEERQEANFSDFWYYKFNSTYADKINAFNDNFDEQLILTLEELKENPEMTLKKIYSFLNVDESFCPKGIGKSYNQGGSYKQNLITRFFFRQSKFRDFLKSNLTITPGMKHLKQKIISRFKQETPEIDERSLYLMGKEFKEDVKKINQNFDLNTENWNQLFNEKDE